HQLIVREPADASFQHLTRQFGQHRTGGHEIGRATRLEPARASLWIRAVRSVREAGADDIAHGWLASRTSRREVDPACDPGIARVVDHGPLPPLVQLAVIKLFSLMLSTATDISGYYWRL